MFIIEFRFIGPNNLIVILGCTATGKTKLAANVASQLAGEVISADSRQVYKGMDIGTGKDLSEFKIGGKKVPYHLIDIVNAGDEYNVFEFQKDFLNVYDGIFKRKKHAVLCGGTGMYLEAVLNGYRLIPIPENKELRAKLEKKLVEELANMLAQYKELHNTTDSFEKGRIIRAIEIAQFEKENEHLINDFPKFKSYLFGINFEREALKVRITKRLKQRLSNDGMIEEVEKLIALGVNPDKLKFYGLEYKFVTQFLLGEISRTEMFNKLNIAIHQFSKRQTTWFRKMERNGFEINWMDGNLPLNEKIDFVLNKISE